MSIQFRKRIKILPWLWLNFSRSGISLSFGGHGFTENIGPKGHQESIRVLPAEFNNGRKSRLISETLEPARASAFVKNLRQAGKVATIERGNKFRVVTVDFSGLIPGDCSPGISKILARGAFW
jgi:hypothetical protein